MILLLGDYSSVHYELSKALKDKGYDVLLLSDGDAYKKIKCDILLPEIKKLKNKFLNIFMTLFRFFGLFGVKNYFIVKNEIERIENIKVVQLINPVIIPSLGAIGNILLIRYLSKKNIFISLCALGDDYNYVSACLNKKFKYSSMDKMYDNGFKSIAKYLYMLKYVYSPLYTMLDFYARKKVNIIIPGLLDYWIAHKSEKKIRDVIELPISKENFITPKKSKYPLKIFHAWQHGKELRKGNDVFDRVIKRYIREFGDSKISYEIVSGLTYDEYIKKYKDSDIVLDQVYSYDRGVTGALGMASGKVVFSGFEEGHFDLGINATSNEEELYKDFVQLINSLDLVDSIKNNAYNFALEKYDSEVVANKYLKFFGF